MRAILPIGPGLIDELQIRLVDECGWIEGVIAALGVQAPLRHRAQLIIEQWEEHRHGIVIAASELSEKGRDVVVGRGQRLVGMDEVAAETYE